MINLMHGDCLEVLRTLPDNSVDSVVTDPPYGLAFMGKKWDYDVPASEVWAECLRVLKPGGYLLAFAGTRTQHRMAVRIEDAGFEIRDMIAWVYGCLSEDSEVLTEEGWMQYNRAKQKNILAYDIQNDVYQWEKPSRWNEYRVESDTAYRIQSDHTDQIVSRGHRCIVERGGVLTFVPADELAGVERVPYLQSDFSALPQGRGELLLETVLRQGKGLAQATFGEREGQEEAGQGACGREKPGLEGRRDLLQAQGEVRGSVDQVRALPESVHEHGSKGRLCNGAPAGDSVGDWQAADPFGVRAPHQPRRDGQQTGEPDAVCDQRGPQAVRARASYQTTVAIVTPIEYSGMIWCPTVSTGAFVARRNGKVFITGNSGFPKSLDVSKAIDKAAGAERECTRAGVVKRDGYGDDWDTGSSSSRPRFDHPATDAARQWQGWGTALKPALEPITVARKPLIGTVAENVLSHGTGAINVDGCRVNADDGDNRARPPRTPNAILGGGKGTNLTASEHNDAGRWPANLIHSGEDDAIAGLGEQARFFYCAKASKRDRDEGLEGFALRAPDHGKGNAAGGLQVSNSKHPRANIHPTVKPTDLMRYLCRLVTPPGGVVLDPFMGSGSTGKAALLEGFQFIGIEREAEYLKIASARINAVQPNIL
jgi:site-specific DNA-methyltransferase (adenine-specific)